MKKHPPHANDYPILDRMKRIGIEPGKSYSASAQPKEVQETIKAAPADALPRIKAAWAEAGVLANGWRTNLTAIGTYSLLAIAARAEPPLPSWNDGASPRRHDHR